MTATMTAELREEHAVIRRLLLILDRICDRLELSREVEPAQLREVVRFIRLYADRFHHAREEDVLFPALEETGIASTGGPIGVMMYEHEVARRFVDGMDDAAQQYGEQDGEAATAFIGNARNYIGLMGMHIEKEDQILYPMADEVLSGPRKEQLAAELGRVRRQEEAVIPVVELMAVLDSLQSIYLGA